jgi:glutamate formiminotransferase
MAPHYLTLVFYRYRSLGHLEQKRLEEDEDKVLGATLFNITAFMIHLKVEKMEIKKKVRRIIGKAHIGMSQSQFVGQLLAKLDYVVSL